MMLTTLAAVLFPLAQGEGPIGKAAALGVDPPTVRVVCIGDDWAAAHRGGPKPWAERLGIQLESRFGGCRFEVENATLRGDTTVSALRRLNRDVLTRDPDVVVMQYGFADSAVDLPREEDFPAVAPGAFGSNLVDLISGVRALGSEIVLVQPGARVWTPVSRSKYGMPPFNLSSEFGFDRLGAAYAGIVSGAGAEQGVRVIPVHEADRLRGADAMAAYREPDGRLPSAEAHAWVAERLAEEIAGMAKRRAENGELRKLSAHTAPSRGWTLPEIDLASNPERVITVDREAGQYLGHPSTETMEDGSILCVYPKGHGRGALLMKRSLDWGRTWSERLPVPASWATSKETPTLYRVPKPGGGENVVMWSGLYPARRALSTDGGESWGELESPLADEDAKGFGGIVVMGDQANLPGGRTLAWFHDDGRFLREKRGPGGFGVFQVETRDGGDTWSQPREIVRWAHGHLCEPGVVERGGTMVLLLRENSRRRNSQFVTSKDGGETWGRPKPLPGALTGDRHQVVELPDGRLFISFRDMGLASPRRGDWVAWVGSFDDLIEGRQGDLRVRLMDNLKGTDCAYPALEVLPDGSILAVTYGHWTAGESPWIAALRIRPEELVP